MKIKSVFIYLILFSILTAFTRCNNEKRDIIFDNTYREEIKEARNKQFLFMAGNRVPGASFAISVDNEIIYSEGLGLASKDLNVPVTRKTKFRIGEVSELFTSLLFHLLTEKGMLHPDSAVRHYLPDFPVDKTGIRLQHLVNQTSGLRQPTTEEKNWRGLNVTLQQGLLNFDKDTLVFKPGMYQMLSMYNYNLLGGIMEKVTQKPFSRLLEEFITDTLNLNGTVVDHPLATVENRSDFFDYNIIAQVVHATFRDLRYRAPSQGLLSTAEDLVKFGNAVLNSEYISDEIGLKLFQPVELSDGTKARMTNGWMLLQTSDGRTAYGRSGQITGGAAALLIFPEEKVVVAGACNLTVEPTDIPVLEMVQPFLKRTSRKNN